MRNIGVTTDEVPGPKLALGEGESRGNTES